MLKLIAITFIALFAINFSANAHCGNCGMEKDGKTHGKDHKHEKKAHSCKGCELAKKTGKDCAGCKMKKRAKKAHGKAKHHMKDGMKKGHKHMDKMKKKAS